MCVLSSAAPGPGQPGERLPRPGQGERDPGRGHSPDPGPGRQGLLVPDRQQAPRGGALRDRPQGERPGRPACPARPKLREAQELQVRHRRGRLQRGPVRQVSVYSSIVHLPLSHAVMAGPLFFLFFLIG